LEFLVLVLVLDQPKWVLATIANTIFGSFLEMMEVNWGLLLYELIRKIVAGIEKRKPSVTSPYLFYLYNRNECLREDEMDKLKIARSILDFSV